MSSLLVQSIVALVIVCFIGYRIVVVEREKRAKRRKIERKETLDAGLLRAVSEKDLQEIARLAGEGADLAHQDPETGETSLEAAVRGGNAEVLALLLEKGAGVFSDSDYQRAYACLPKRGKNAEADPLMKLLLPLPAVRASIEYDKRATREEKTERINRQLLRACQKGDTEKAAAALAKGADVDVVLDDSALPSLTPLMLAVERGSLELASLLLERGAKVNKKSAGETAMSIAVAGGHEAIVSLLAAKGARAPGPEERLKLHIEKGQLDRVRTLLDAGANPNFRYPDGTTPLHVAASWNKPEIAALLLDRGARTEEKNSLGATTLASIANRGSREMMSLLLARGSSVEFTPSAPRTYSLGTQNNEVVIENPNSFAVIAEVKSDSTTKAVLVGPASRNSLSVTAGGYDVFFEYANQLGAVYQGDRIQLDGARITIRITQVSNGNYGIRRVR